MNQKIKDREIEKYYLCVVHGRMTPSEGKAGGLSLQGRGQKPGHSPQVSGARGAGPPSPSTRPWRSGTACPWWSASSSPAGPIRSGPSSPPPATPCWETASMAKSPGQQAVMTENSRRFAPYKLAFSFSTDAGVLESSEWPVLAGGTCGFRGRVFPRIYTKMKYGKSH